MFRSKRAICAVLSAILSGVTLLVAAAPVAARSSVDPATLNPAPPDFFNAACFEGAGGVICTLAFSDPDVVDEPSGVVCGTEELRISFSRSVVGKRFYDGDGNLVQRHFREAFNGTFRNAATGKIADWDQHDTVLHNLAVPGDAGTGLTKVSGIESHIRLPGRATILTDAGMFIVDEATGEEVAASGHHPFDDYFGRGDVSALAPLCDALD